MPPIKVEYVHSFSSEDPVHIANNVLTNDSKKWKCRTPGEKTAVIVLQLEKATEITGIDIGNEHSAYIEVLVSRSGGSDDYKGLLIASAFMTPLEARQSQNINQVRMFTKEHFSKPECDEKWDRVKVVCTQPFNRHVQYGLSFIILHTNEGKAAASTVQSNIGKFALRPASPDIFTAGTLFAKRKELEQEEKLTGAAAIREAASLTSLARYGSPKCKPKLKTTDSIPTPSRTKIQHSEDLEEQPQKDRNRTGLFYSEDDDKPNAKIDRIIEKKKEEAEEKQKAEGAKQNDKKKKEEAEEKQKAEGAKQNDKKKKKEEAEKKHKAEGAKQNDKKKNFWGTPETKKKDSEAIENQKHKRDEEKHKQKDTMVGKGAKGIENDKLDSPSTSKPKETKDDGRKDLKRKVRDAALERESAKKKKVSVTKPFNRLLEGVTIVVSGIQNPDRGMLRTTALSMGAKYKPDWEAGCTHLICAFPNTPKFNQVKGKGKIVKKAWLEDCHKQRKRLPWRRYALDKTDKGKDESEDEICETIEMDTRIDVAENVDTDFSDHKDEGSDTEERIAKILAAQSSSEKKNQTPSPATNGDIYSAETDEEEPSEKPQAPEIKDLIGIFDGKIFYVDQSFDDETFNKLKKYIVAYRGKAAETLTDGVDVIVTTRQNSATHKEINGDVSCVGPAWIWKCHNERELVAVDDYLY